MVAAIGWMLYVERKVTRCEVRPNMSIEIWVDADATPRDALASVDELAKVFGALVTTVSSIRHEHHRARHIMVDPAPQAADMAILSNLRKDVDNIVVTQDYGLAALALGRGAKVLSPRGVEFTNDNIDLFLFERDLHQRERQLRHRCKGPKPRTKEDPHVFGQPFHSCWNGWLLVASNLYRRPHF